MRKRWFLVGMMFLLLPWLLVGCWVAQEEYDAVIAERDSLAANLQSVQSEFEATKSKLDSVQSELESIKTDFQSVKDELDAKISELESIENELDTKTSALNSANNQLDSLEVELNKVKDEVAEIKQIYPPRHFNSYSELLDWLRLNEVSDRQPSETAENLYGKALDIQEAALKDGYIVSAWIEYYPEEEVYGILCTAIVDGDVWMWDVEGDEPVNFSELFYLMSVR